MSDENPTPSLVPPAPPRRRRGLLRWILPLLALAIVSALGFVLYLKLQSQVWAYFTDDEGTRVEVQDDKARPVLWEDSKPTLFTKEATAPGADLAARPAETIEAAFSANGTMMALVRQDGSDGNTDLYLSTWNGRTWSPPAPVTSVNTNANERSPAFSRDGRFLYFSSDREGGIGGNDIYVARWDGSKWTGVETLGDSINSPADENGPATGADDSRLYFSSNRGTAGANDIFVANRIEAESVQAPAPEAEHLTEHETVKPTPSKRNKRGKPTPATPAQATSVTVPLPPVPVFEPAEAVTELNSSADDVQSALTARGDQVFLASNRDREETENFAIYLSRVVAGKTLPPEPVDLYLAKGDATDPAVRMDGFDLLFSTNTGGYDQGLTLHQSTTREVIAYTDLTRWVQFNELMRKIGWRILLALAALAGLLYLLEHWRDITSLYHKCLAGSVAVHLLILMLMMLWRIAQEMDTGGKPSSDVAISIDALAEEELAMESEPEVSEIAETRDVVVTEKVQSDFMIPVFQPQTVSSDAAPIVTQTSKSSLVPDVRPSMAQEAQSKQPVVTDSSRPLEMLTALSETALPEPDLPELKEQVADVQETEQPADQTADLFKPSTAMQKVETRQATELKIAEQAAADATEAKDVDRSSATAETKDTGGETVVAHRGLEADGIPPALDGADTLVTKMLNLPGEDSSSDPLLPGKLETPEQELDAAAMTKLIQKTRGRPSLETIVELGGSGETEKAIRDGLDWLVRNQEGDGRWDVGKHGAKGSYDTAGTGLALLCFYGWGARHDQAGPYQAHVKRAIEWLIGQQKEDGDLRSGGRMYCHGIATIALCEAYGMTKDVRLKGPAEKAIALILASQSPTKGGWRYEPAGPKGPSQDADLSVTGWQYMALNSARMAGLEVPDSAFVNARRYFDAVSSGKHGGLYGYVPGKVTPAMVATGMFCRQLDLVEPSAPNMQESAAYLKMKPLNVKSPDQYYLYYATLALYQHQGPVWDEWNKRLKEVLPAIQIKQGANGGSWDPGGPHIQGAGRVVSTTLSILSLEVYYRLLPMYGFRHNEALPAAERKDQ